MGPAVGLGAALLAGIAPPPTIRSGLEGDCQICRRGKARACGACITCLAKIQALPPARRRKWILQAMRKAGPGRRS